MSSAGTLETLLLAIQLTAEQREQIERQTGITTAVLPYESTAAVVRCRFGGISLRVARGVFAPLPGTERLLEAARRTAVGHEHGVTIVDVGTGCGAVALALATELPNASIFATDISELAIRCARRNRTRLGLHNVTFRCGSLVEPLPRRLRGKVDTMVANVPYVPPRLRDQIGDAFPAGTALGTEEDGLGLVRALAKESRRFLVAGGSLVLQLASYQWIDFRSELGMLGYSVPELRLPGHVAPVIGRAIWGP